MTIEAFKKFVKLLTEVRKKSQEIYDTGIELDVIEDPFHEIITLLLKVHYGEIGEDYISWWLYEDVEKKIYDSNNKKVIANLTKVEDLWKYCEKIRKAKDFKEYVPQPPLTQKQKEKVIKELFSKK